MRTPEGHEVVDSSESSRVLQVRVTEKYGRETIYPDCERSRLFAELLKQTTLTRTNIEVIKKLGFEFKTRNEEL